MYNTKVASRRSSKVAPGASSFLTGGIADRNLHRSRIARGSLAGFDVDTDLLSASFLFYCTDTFGGSNASICAIGVEEC